MIKMNSVLRAVCPACDTGPMMSGVFSVNPKCSHCGYSFQPEQGFYLGAIMIAYLVTGVLVVPVMLILKFLEVETVFLMGVPFIEAILLGSFLVYYAKVLWLHLEFQATRQLNKT